MFYGDCGSTELPLSCRHLRRKLAAKIAEATRPDAKVSDILEGM